MPKLLRDPLYKFPMQRIGQISDAHCGPAVIQMLLSNVGIYLGQPSIVDAGDARERIEQHGMRIDQMGKAVVLLAPQTQYWFKENAGIKDIQIILAHGYPVGVEWQGDFSDDEEEAENSEYADWDFNKDDAGHYSVITHIDREKDEIIIVDPYKNFSARDRIFSVDDFINRWWDTNEVINPITQRPHMVRDHHMIFIVTPKDALFPLDLNMKRI